MSGIVVGVDGSPHSQRALDWAITEAALRHAPLTVLAVNPIAAGVYGPGYAPESYPSDEEGRARLQQAIQEMVDKALIQHAGEPPESVTVQAVSGLPADELIKASESAGLLVVGARGAGGFARLVMGSVSTQVAHHAVCPIVVVPGKDSAR